MGGCPTRRCSRRRLRRFPRLDKNARLGPAERRAVAYKIVATAHLISGLPCSGKTTYSKALGGDLNSVHFALDYWLITAVGAYTMESVGDEEHVRRCWPVENSSGGMPCCCWSEVSNPQRHARLRGSGRALDVAGSRHLHARVGNGADGRNRPGDGGCRRGALGYPCRVGRASHPNSSRGR
jgi:hypothetical protein